MAELLKCPLCSADMPHTTLLKEKSGSENQTHIYICETCPGILIEWLDHEDTKAFVEYFNHPVESARKSSLLKISEELKVRLKDIEYICAHFELATDLFIEEYKEGNIQAFDSYGDFFVWMHQDMSRDDLVKHIVNGTNGVNNEQVLELDDGRTIFLYK